jgi:hypothetical protein
VDAEREEVVEPAAQPGRPVRELVRECALSSLQIGGRLWERAIQSPAALALEADLERDLSPRARGGASAQSSIPLVGDDGTAISRAGIRPAR